MVLVKVKQNLFHTRMFHILVKTSLKKSWTFATDYCININEPSDEDPHNIIIYAFQSFLTSKINVSFTSFN